MAKVRNTNYTNNGWMSFQGRRSRTVYDLICMLGGQP